MSELRSGKHFPVQSLLMLNLPEKRHKICRSKEKIDDELPEDITDIFQRNMIVC